MVYIEVFSRHLLHGMAMAVPIQFSPVKLLLLVAWFYACVYVVQSPRFGLLVTGRHRTRMTVASLLAGPLILLVLLVRNICLEASVENKSLLEKIRDRLSSLVADDYSAPDPKISLFDPTGRSIHEIYDGKGSGVVKLTEQILRKAIDENASDILIDPKGSSSYSIRIRVDGVLRTINDIDMNTCGAVINSIKAVSCMDIAEKRRPQDGSFSAITEDGTVSFRAASAGVLNGEKLALRVLNQGTEKHSLDNIGLSRKQAAILTDAIGKPSGMLLLCGPTGSGKTTTLYGMLNKIDLSTRNVITVEDPIEYVLPNASQIEINPKAGITFAKTLRSILRQDPDVICVGEVRDEETAAIAISASQTGHLVLATMHSSTSAAALVRLLDLGISPIMLASGLDIVISQRLLRRLCSKCKVPATLSSRQIQYFQQHHVNYDSIYRAVGCEKCHSTGYSGRIGVFDFLVLDSELKAGIAKDKAWMEDLRKSGEKKGKSNLKKQAIKVVVSGITGLDELKRVVG